MSLRQGLWQRIVGACLAVLIVLALEAIIPSVANTTSQTAKAKASSVQTASPKPEMTKIVECKYISTWKTCTTKYVPSLALDSTGSSSTTKAQTNSSNPASIQSALGSFDPSNLTSERSGRILWDDVIESLPRVIFGPSPTTTQPPTTTTTTKPPTTTTTTKPPTTTTTTTPPSPTGTPGPSNRNILVNSGPITITTDGAVVQNINVTGQITVAANNVTIRNFRANNIYKNPGKVGLLMEYGDIHGEQNDSADGVVWSDYTARYLNVYNIFDAFKAHGNVLIENCWVHDLKFKTGPAAGAGGYTHNDGVQVSSGNNVTVRNSIFERNLGNSAIFIDADQGPISNVTIEGNRLGGGGFTLYSIQSRSAPQFGRPTNVMIRNNVFTEEHHYDYATIAATGTTWTNNRNLSGGLINTRIDNY